MVSDRAILNLETTVQDVSALTPDTFNLEACIDVVTEMQGTFKYTPQDEQIEMNVKFNPKISADVAGNLQGSFEVNDTGCSLVAKVQPYPGFTMNIKSATQAALESFNDLGINFQSKENYPDDVACREPLWLQEHSCKACFGNSHKKDCSVFNLDDWELSGYLVGNMAAQAALFTNTMEKVIKETVLGMNMARAVDNGTYRLFLKKLRSHPYIIYLTHIDDALLSEKLLPATYKIRVALGYNGDYGRKFKLPFLAQGPTEHLNGTFVDAIMEKMREIGTNAKNTIADVIKVCLNKIQELFDTMFSMIMSAAQFLIKGVAKMLFKIAFHIFGDCARVYIHEHKNLFVVAVLVLSVFTVSFFVSAGLFAYDAGLFIIKKICGLTQPESGDFVAQGPERDLNPVSFVLSLVAGLFAFTSGVAMKTLRERMLCLTALVAGGTIVANYGKMFFMLLPEALRLAIMYKFAPASAQLKYELDTWRDRAIAILKLCRISDILASKDYYGHVKELVSTGRDLLSKVTNPADRTLLLGIYSQLLRTYSILHRFQQANVNRPPPYCIHISGSPGVGKTLLIQSLISKLGYGIEDVYQRPVADPYWSGYVSHKIVVYDEFLIGSETREAIAKEYLALVSSAAFMPPMASVDDPTVGIKGTCARPEVVISINNHDYNRVPGIPDEALQRRRRHVIRVGFRESANRVDNSVDLASYTPEEIRDFVWAHFTFMPPQFHAVVRANSMAYLDMIDLLTMDFTKHNDICKSLASANLGCIIDKPPSELIAEALREMEGIPQKQAGILDELINLSGIGSAVSVASGFTGQGPKKGKKTKDDAAVNATIIFDPYLHPPSVRSGSPSCVEARESDTDSDNGISFFPEQTEVKTLEPMLYAQAHVSPPLSYELCPDELLVAERDIRGTVLKYVKPMVLVCSIVGLAYALYTYITGRDKEEPLTFCGQGSGELTHKTRTGKQGRHRQKWTRGDRAAYSDNYYGEGNAIRVTLSMDGLTPVTCVPLKDRRVLTYAHALCDEQGLLANETSMKFKVNGKYFDQVFDPQKCIIDMENDLAILEIESKHAPQFSNNIKNFIRDTEFMELDRIPAVLTTYREDGTETFVTVATRVMERSYTAHEYRRTLEHAFVYEAITNSGDCGAPLCIRSGNFAGKILGIHVGGKMLDNGIGIGLATVVTYDMLVAALASEMSVKDIVVEQDEFQAQGVVNYTSEQAEEHLFDLNELPNAEIVTYTPLGSAVFLNQQTKLRHSCIASTLPWTTAKAPPVLKTGDVRCGGVDPIEKMVVQTLSSPHTVADQNLVTEVYETMFENYSRQLNWKIGKRTMTFLEALKGLPGILCSVNTKTSPGFPLIRFRQRGGKKDSVWFDDFGELHYTPEFESLVHEFVERMDTWDHGIVTDGSTDHIWLGYFKDELVSEEKVVNARTRIIFCGNFIATVAFRMKFGFLLAAFNNSWAGTPMAVGANQYSHDMDTFHSYLTEVGNKFVAGDYKNFDKLHHAMFRKAAYNLMMDYCKDIPEVTQKNIDFFLSHEMYSFAQMGRYRFLTKSNHMSGCFFTTIINCLVNEGYLRYVFTLLNPLHIFDQHVRIKVLGDDHIICCSEDVIFDGRSIRDKMLLIGQIYTSDNKDDPDPGLYRPFKELTFLGAHPKLVVGRWSGALKKATLEQAIYWTRDKDLSLDQVVLGMLELASQWEQNFYLYYKKSIVEAYAQIGRTCPIVPSYGELRRTVAWRTASSGLNFVAYGVHDILQVDNFYGQGSDPSPEKVICIPDIEEQIVMADEFVAQGNPMSHPDDLIYEPDFDIELANDFVAQGPKAGPDGFGYFDPNDQTLDYYGKAGPHNMVEPTFTVNSANFFDAQGPAGGMATRFASPGYQPISEEEASKLSDTIPGLTTLSTSRVVHAEKKRPVDMAHKGLNEQEMDLKYGTNSLVYRTDIEWNSSQAQGQVLLSLKLPGDLLSIGNTSNIQNMPFQRFVYWTGDMEVGIQVNGTPFQTGMLCVYFYPLSADGSDLAVTNWTACHHVRITPCTNDTSIIHIPFRYPRQVWNTYSAELAPESSILGSLCFGVLSPLSDVSTSGKCTVSIFSSFPNSKFTLPRPIPVTLDIKKVDDFTAQGQGSSKSTTNNINSYTIHDVAGNLPIQNGSQTAKASGSKQEITTKIDAEIPLPMDNPPCVSGSIPVHNVFSGMSTSVGVEPTVGLQLHPTAMDHYHESQFDAEESKISYLLGRTCLLHSFPWNAIDASSTTLLRFPLNSLLQEFISGANMQSNLAVLNSFVFWHADIVLELVVVRTNYHSGRLRVTVGYGAPELLPADQILFSNHVLDFSGDVSRHEILIPWNAATNMLRTYEGEEDAVLDPVQNYSLGTCAIYVANELRANVATVAEEVQVLLFIRFDNARVSVPRPIPFYTMNGSQTNQTVSVTVPEILEVDEFEGQGPEDVPVHQAEDQQVSDMSAQIMTATTAEEIPSIVERPCLLNSGEKFEFCVSDIHEVLRRMIPINAFENPAAIDGVLEYAHSDTFSTTTTHCFDIAAIPANILVGFYAAWAGSLRYRLMVPTTTDNETTFVLFYPGVTGSGVLVGDKARLATISHLSSLGASATVEQGLQNGTKFANSGQGGAILIAHEQTLAPKSGLSYIDVMVPFQSHFNYLVTPTFDDQHVPTQFFTRSSVGTLSFQFPTAGKIAKLFQAVGDDMHVGIFRPPIGLTMKEPTQTGPLPTGVYNIGGFCFKV